MTPLKRLTIPVKFHFTAFVLWSLISLIFPLVSGTIGIVDAGKCLAFFFVATCTGEYLMGWVPFIRQIPPMLRMGFSMITGGIVLFTVFSFLPAPILLYVLLVLFAAVYFFSKNVTWEIDGKGVAALLPVCILLLSVIDISLATTAAYTTAPGDYFYYDALVVSLSKTVNINESLFHIGIPVNYQTLTFLSPAALAYSTGIPAHIALDGMFMPVMKVLSFSMISASVVYLFAVIRGEKALSLSWKYYLGASIAILLLAPLHPLYLLKFNVRNFILLGEGYLLPMGSMGFALSILLFGVSNYFFFMKDKRTISDIVLFVILLAAIAVAKAAMFFPVLAFYGLYALIIFITDRKDARIIYLVLGLLGGFFLMKIFVGNEDGILKTSITLNEGHYLGLFRDTMQKFNKPATILTGIIFFGVMFVLWLGLKTILFSSAILSKDNLIKSLRPYIIACLGGVIVSILPGFFIKMLMVDEQGQTLQNTTFDTSQFLRAALFISTFIAVVALLFIWDKKGSYKNKIFRGVVLAWFALAGLSFTVGLLEPVPPSATNKQWENAVIKDFSTVHPKLMAMLSTTEYSGQTLLAREIYPWYTCTKRGDGSGYVCTLRSNYRNRLLEGLMNDAMPREKKTTIVQQLQREGVDALVATPVNKNQFEKLVADSIITKPASSTWIYNLKK